MKILTVISKGRGIIIDDCLRCSQPRKDDINKICNKLLVKKNSIGQIAGSFYCQRCNKTLEVKLTIS